MCCTVGADDAVTNRARVGDVLIRNVRPTSGAYGARSHGEMTVGNRSSSSGQAFALAIRTHHKPTRVITRRSAGLDVMVPIDGTLHHVA
jgi:hypothetical protein